jgi:hypothetical protein
MYLLLLPWSGNASVPRCDIDASLSQFAREFFLTQAQAGSSQRCSICQRGSLSYCATRNFKKCIKNKNISKGGPFQNFIKIGIVAPRGGHGICFHRCSREGRVAIFEDFLFFWWLGFCRSLCYKFKCVNS